VGEYTSIVVPADGLPIISYLDFNLGDLKIAKCGDASCASPTAMRSVFRVGYGNTAQRGFVSTILMPNGSTVYDLRGRLISGDNKTDWHLP